MNRVSQVLNGLNEEQSRAVLHPDGPALVIAGAGSGKTRVLTHRIAYLISQGTPAHRILAVTFTNKAAQEMKLRVEALCGPQPDLWIGTFHSMCARLLRLEIARLGMGSNFSILDQQDTSTLLKEVLRELKLEERFPRPNPVREGISRAKNRLVTPQGLQDDDPVLAEIYQAYQRALFVNNALDFDDLLMASVKLLERDVQVREKYQGRFEHVLIDEYQDTNHAQYVLIRLLAGQQPNVFAVGDEDQSIYSFRGAEIRNILDFERDFPATALYRLQQNYRSTQRILDAANALISNNRLRKGKRLWTERTGGRKVAVLEARDQHEEARFVLDAIQGTQAREGASLKDIVVFYRVHALSRVFEEELRLRGLAYRIVGGVGFYERKEVKDALAYMRVLLTPSDSISLRRILNVPNRGIGATTLRMLQDMAVAQGIPLIRAMEKVLARSGFRRKTAEGVQRLLGLLREGAKRQEGLGLSGTLRWILEKSGYLEELEQQKTIEARTRTENLRELISAAEEYEEEDHGAGMAEFLDRVALWTNWDEQQDSDEKVTLMSLHSSKGLEYDYAFVVGLEEGICPYTLWGMNPSEVEEERRLVYVGMTRARRQLWLTCARNRLLFGQRRELQPSRFLEEVCEIDVERMPREEPAPNRHIYQETVQISFAEGDDIVHPRFGQGRVLTCFDQGQDMKVSVRFSREPHPRLLAVRYANLRKV